MNLFILWTGFVAGNFLYQGFKKEKDWDEAFKLSVFQGAALVMAYLLGETNECIDSDSETTLRAAIFNRF